MTVIGGGRLGILTGLTRNATIEQVGVINSSCSNIGTGSNSSGLVGPCAGTTVITDCYTADCNVMAKSTDGETGDAVGGIVKFWKCHSDVLLFDILLSKVKPMSVVLSVLMMVARLFPVCL